MNPPFGTGGRTAVDHLAKASTHLRDGGRIVALIPTGPAADKKFDAWFEKAEGLYLAADVRLPMVTFERAAAKVATRVVVIDKPGKDSFVHREAGATEVIVSSARRWVQMHEARGEAEARLPDLLRRLSPCGLVVVEGFKREAHPKLEVYRDANGRPALHPTDPNIVALASDTAFPKAALPLVDLNDVTNVSEEQ